MSLKGSNNEEKIWNYLIGKISNPYGVAGLMGNLYAESGLIPTNLQNTYENNPTKTFNISFNDASYTAAVDLGTYGLDKFSKDKAGYGLAQWTYWSRKQNLYNFAKSSKSSIGDLEMQLNFLVKELQESFKSVYQALLSAKSVKEASDIVLIQFEAPSRKDDSYVQNQRASNGQKYYDKYASTSSPSSSKGGSTMGYTNSPLVTYKNLTKNKTTNRNHAIDTITIHCIVGQWTAKQGCDYFATTDRQCSANYVVGKDGSIGLSVEEKDRSWCTSSSANDNRAITIETASDATHPYAITEAAMTALIKLVADICKRNNIKKLIWNTDKNLIGQVDKQNMTVHRWFAAKACPGDYLYQRHTYIANEVNKLLGTMGATPATNVPDNAKVDPKELALRQAVVDIAKQWLGCKESDGSHKKIIDYYNEHRPSGAYKMTYSDAWCACYVSAVMMKAGITDIAPVEVSCGRMITKYQQIGSWTENDAYVPKIGDIIMYDWQDDGVGDNQGAADHVGIVAEVNSNGIDFKVIEGNMSNAVGYRDMKVNGKYIRGFACPHYSRKVGIDLPKPVTDNNNKIPAVPFTCQVLVPNLYIRENGTGTAKTKGFITKGVYTITQVNANGFGKLKSGVGWIYVMDSDCVKILSTVASTSASTPVATEFPYRVRITIDNLNIRTTPSAKDNSNLAKKYTGKGTFTIVAEATGPVNAQGKVGKWGLLKSYESKRNGWICLDVDGVSKL